MNATYPPGKYTNRANEIKNRLQNVCTYFAMRSALFVAVMKIKLNYNKCKYS